MGKCVEKLLLLRKLKATAVGVRRDLPDDFFFFFSWAVDGDSCSPLSADTLEKS